MTFARLGLLDILTTTAHELGYSQPTPIQQQAIPAVLAGRDLLAAAQTGTGKTAAFALPLLHTLSTEGARVSANHVRSLILVPTRELADQLLTSLQRYAQGLPLRIHAAYGGVSINPQMMKLRKGLDILIATPGRLLDLYQQNAVRFDQLQLLVLDEADRMLDLGFAQELQAVLGALPKQRQTLLFSATFSDAIRQLASTRLHNPISIDVSPRNSTARNVKQWLIPVDKKRKPELLLTLLEQRGNKPLLVFGRTRKGVQQLEQQLIAAGLRADSIHGDKPQPSRLRALARFKSGEVRILVATDVAARGLDIPDLPLVINLDLPNVAEDYIHRIGRTGRAGNQGEAISLVSADEVEYLAAIERLIKQTLPREEEPGFSPEHRVPTTQAGQPQKKPKKPKKPKDKTSVGKGKIHLGELFEAPPKPARAIRGKPLFKK
ncbi:DEAD/DEAH box helicase [Atopomonas sediminilitoris]|uniref:DEAD/DEAH box helicase n=1 Tax=Atopomonas sediminilitoris TaxID=2919919 RepID=UPI001F4D53A0|nr:DEAD/DEAH box helicase [Atopomonas sediminilitoris]MCJ8170229.1 DEAD/DEAH box helicase [Atopomonas sediminilitoris]